MSATNKETKHLRIKRTPEQWRVIFDRYLASGQTSEQFCREQGISHSTFGHWRTKLRKQPSSQPLPADATLFTELTSEVPTPVSPGWDIELQLGADVVLRLRRSC
ncbi:MAG: transposase [Chromatiaceae bacterium]|nr:transposase [Chromatiaceae bacterium]